MKHGSFYSHVFLLKPNDSMSDLATSQRILLIEATYSPNHLRHTNPTNGIPFAGL